jgi:cytochrome c-type biogenesis protein CcmI
MLITIIGLALVLLASFFIAWPLLSAVEPETRGPSAASDGAESDPEHDKELALRAIREADFDHRTGKLSDEDHAQLRQELEERALRALAALDEASALRAVQPAAAQAAAATSPSAGEPGGFCPACGTRFLRGARFCPGCGKKLPAAVARGRRRA